jgi:hypothetical protein
MGKDKKERNPADQFRKEQRKKELLKLKKDRAVVRDVREMLNDPRKIDAEIAKVQKQSDENKLDKTLKDRIKELQRMKDVANTRQLVLAAQGKISQEELANITKPSIYQSNDGVWDDPKSAKTNAHPHVKSASRISTEGLPVYTRAHADPNVVICLAGNKCDKKPGFDLKRCEEAANTLGATFFQTSALTGEGVQEIFENLSRNVFDVYQSSRKPSKDIDAIRLNSGPAESQKGCC